jgi:hypothetical protein
MTPATLLPDTEPFMNGRHIATRWRFQAIILLAFVAGGIVAGRNAQQPKAASPAGRYINTVLVDTSRVVRVIPPNFFGINYVAFWDDDQGSVASARALAQTPIRMVRFAGGIPGDWYDWADPYYKAQSRTSPLQLWTYARSFGALPLFQTNYQGHLPNPPGRSYAVNSPQNAAAWVTYNMTAGIPAAMEVGNEEDVTMKAANDSRFQPYVDAFNAQARAMHRANPRVMVYGPAGTNEWYWWELDSLGMFLRGAGNRTGSGQVDGVSLHFYKGNSWADSMSVAQYWLSPSGPWAAIQKSIAAHDTRQLPVRLTEWNLGSTSFNNQFTPTLGHALATADMLGAFAQSGLAGEDYFDIHGASGWGLLYGTGENRPADSPTPTYYAMALWSQMGKQVLPLVQSEDASKVMSTYATRAQDGSYQVMAINKQPTPETVRVLLNGATPAGHRLRVYTLGPVAGSVLDHDARYNGVTMPSPQLPLPAPRQLGAVKGNVITYRVPGYTTVVLSLDGATPAPRTNQSITPNQSREIAPAPTLAITATGSVASKTVARGGHESVTATVTSNADAGTVVVDLEIYGPDGKKAFQQSQTVELRANRPVQVMRDFALPSGAARGQYQVKIGVFGPTWSPLYTWTNDGGSFTVT